MLVLISDVQGQSSKNQAIGQGLNVKSEEDRSLDSQVTEERWDFRGQSSVLCHSTFELDPWHLLPVTCGISPDLWLSTFEL